MTEWRSPSSKWTTTRSGPLSTTTSAYPSFGLALTSEIWSPSQCTVAVPPSLVNVAVVVSVPGPGVRADVVEVVALVPPESPDGDREPPLSPESPVAGREWTVVGGTVGAVVVGGAGGREVGVLTTVVGGAVTGASPRVGTVTTGVTTGGLDPGAPGAPGVAAASGGMVVVVVGAPEGVRRG